MKFGKLLIIGMVAMSMASCSGNDGPDGDDDLTAKEKTLKEATADYVNNTVLPTYSAMADAAIEMRSLCHAMQEKFSAGTLTKADVQAAGEAWKRARKNWELSEAFLYGPAANHNIDPHIDSWPLDKAAMENLLAQIRTGGSWSLDR